MSSRQVYETISAAMDTLAVEYAPNFIRTKERLEIWSRMLKGFDQTVIKAAIWQIISTSDSPYPPSIGKIRSLCSDLSNGRLQAKTGIEAWGNVLDAIQHIRDDNYGSKLTQNEKAALRQVGNINDIAQSDLRSLGYTRAAYIKAFDNIIAKQKLEDITLPSIKAVVAHNKPSLHPKPKQKTDKEPEVAPVPLEDIKALVASLADKKGI